MKKGLPGSLAAFSRNAIAGFFHVAVEERDADHALFRRVDVLTVDFEVLLGLLSRPCPTAPRWSPSGTWPAVSGSMSGNQVGSAIGVGVEVVEADVLHLVVALRVGQRVVVLAQVPLAGEVGLVAALLEHRGKGPFRGRAGRRPGPGRPRWSCRCGWGCGRSASPRGPGCNSAEHKTKTASSRRPPCGRRPVWACRAPPRRRMAQGHHSRCRRTR